MDGERHTVDDERLTRGRPDNGDVHEDGNGASPASRTWPGETVREMIHHDRRTSDHERASTASADAVESVRLSIRDLKHDVRMLKVGLDKQTQMLDRISALLARLERPHDGG